MRYSKKHRQDDLKTKVYNDRLDDEKKDNCIKLIEAHLSKFNLKSINFTDLLDAFTERSKVLLRLIKLYNQNKVFIQKKFHRYINKQTSEAKLLSRFKEKFGDKNKVIIVWGDYKQNNGGSNGSMMYKRLFKKAGYRVYQIDEYNTSKLCATCEEEMVFHKVKSEEEKCSKCKHNLEIAYYKKLLLL
jgi:hypothetical protein